MTLSESTQLLEAYPPDMRAVAVVGGYKEGCDDLEQHLISVKEIRLDAGEKWWEGRHRDSCDDRTGGSAVVDALVPHRPTKA